MIVYIHGDFLSHGDTRKSSSHSTIQTMTPPNGPLTIQKKMNMAIKH
jgi:hypothetical protein